jgi:AraC-like DNA-binding protein
VRYFGDHFHESTPLPELAAKFGLAPSVLSRTFRRDWGKPPIHFRNYLRILDSFRHLAGETAVTNVAFEVGFNDLSRFMKQFKGTVGHTPHSIRKKSKNAK